MTILEIVLIIIGLTAVVLSFKIGDKKDNNEEKKSEEKLEDNREEIIKSSKELESKLDSIMEQAEDKLLNSIKQNSQINIYDKLGKVLTNITVDSVSTENNAINKNGLKYQRFAVKDGGIPSATVIDDFVDFIKNKPEGQHLHFHCDAGEGRTSSLAEGWYFP